MVRKYEVEKKLLKKTTFLLFILSFQNYGPNFCEGVLYITQNTLQLNALKFRINESLHGNQLSEFSLERKKT